MFFLKNICFLCLRDDQKNLKNMLHLDDENKISLQYKLEYCIAELMNTHFEIPKLVCATCQQYLDFVYIFKQKCIQNNNRLKQYIEQLKPNKPFYDDKYQSLHVCVSDIKSIKKPKLEDADQLFSANAEFNNENIEYISETHVPLEDYELNKELFINTDNIIIKEEIDFDLFNEVHSEKIEYYSITNSYCEDATNEEFQVMSDPDLLISQACRKMFDEEIQESFSNLIDDNSNNNKQLILTSDSQEIVFEIDSSILTYKPKDSNLAENSQEKHEEDLTEDADDTRDSDEEVKEFDIYKIKRDDITGKYHCTFCDKSYSKSTKFDIHLRKFHIEDKPFHCRICPEKFQFRSKLKIHMNKLHDDAYACKICDKKFARNCDLTTHLKLHAEKAYQCNICLKKFRRKYHYTNHLTTHTGEKAFECPDCDKKFSTSFNLAAHSRVHTGVKLYSCTICGKAFKYWLHRRSHMDLHIGYKRYACKVCPSKFTYKSGLREHMMIHLNARAFKCTVCNKGFNKKYHLSEHMKTHSKIRVVEKVKCDVCEKVCTKGVAMKNHMKMHGNNVVK